MSDTPIDKLKIEIDAESKKADDKTNPNFDLSLLFE